MAVLTVVAGPGPAAGPAAGPEVPRMVVTEGLAQSEGMDSGESPCSAQCGRRASIISERAWNQIKNVMTRQCPCYLYQREGVLPARCVRR